MKGAVAPRITHASSNYVGMREKLTSFPRTRTLRRQIELLMISLLRFTSNNAGNESPIFRARPWGCKFRVIEVVGSIPTSDIKLF